MVLLITQKNIGKLFTSNPTGLKNLTIDAEVLQIMRAAHTLPNAQLVKELSPSKSLFMKYSSQWKGTPHEIWWPKYKHEFEKEFEKEIVINSLRDIYRKLLKGKNVVLVCFCSDHKICHRSLVGEFFRKYNVDVIELNPVKSEQLDIFSGGLND